MAWEFLDRRALALLSFVDALGRPVLTPLRIDASGIRLLTKRPGVLVVMDAAGLSAHTAAFEAPPATPVIGSISVPMDIVPADPAYGARRFALALPRDPDPANAANANSLFRAVEIPLLPGPPAAVAGMAAALRVSVTRSDDGHRIEGALVRLRPDGGRPQARAMTDAAGDALLLVPGVPLSMPGMGGVVLPDIGAELDAVIDPALVRFNAADELLAARAAAAARTTGLIDPDDVETRLGGAATGTQALRIAAGQTRTAAIAWIPP
ncbi:MAG: hypothetical protein AB7F35_05110 [Acetobacteraceae bacterium]